MWLDPFRAVFFDTPTIWASVENHHSAPVSYALRIWIFDASSRLKGTADFCSGDTLDRSMRTRVIIPLDVRGVTMRDRAVVTVVAAGSQRAVWTLRESDADQLAAARSASQGSSGRLSLDRRDPGAVAWSCPWECQAIEATCHRRCDDRGLSAFTCAPTLGMGCSASCTCK